MTRYEMNFKGEIMTVLLRALALLLSSVYIYLIYSLLLYVHENMKCFL